MVCKSLHISLHLRNDAVVVSLWVFMGAMDVYGFLVLVHGFWESAGVYRCLGASMGIYGCLWVSMGVCGCQWVPIGVYGFLGVYGCLWVSGSMSIYGYHGSLCVLYWLGKK